MSSRAFILLGVTYYVISLIIILVVLYIINKKTKNKNQLKLTELEREKNLIISTGILTELNKVEALINSKELQVKFKNWTKRFNSIKDEDIPKITDALNELEELYNAKKYI